LFQLQVAPLKSSFFTTQLFPFTVQCTIVTSNCNFYHSRK